jgi:shikimate kinase
MDGSKPIVLIGFMGVGKTSLGKKLAKKLNWGFIDTDKWIEKKEGKSISQIFKESGEAYFRGLERDLVLEFKNIQNTVIATGGGLPCFHDNMNQLNELAVTIYLRKEASQLYTHLKNIKASRPLIANLNDDELYSYIELKLIEREKYYHQAQYIIQADRNALDQIMESIF